MTLRVTHLGTPPPCQQSKRQISPSRGGRKRKKNSYTGCTTTGKNVYTHSSYRDCAQSWQALKTPKEKQHLPYTEAA